MRRKLIPDLLASIICILFMNLFSCESGSKDEAKYPDISRAESLPVDIVKRTPESDMYPPVLHSTEWEYPVPIGTPVNTAGAEDSPFIPADRDELYFFFTPDVRIPAEQQIFDSVTGIYVSEYSNNTFSEPERVWLQDPGKLSLDGAEFVEGNTMLFATAREGYTGIHWFSAEYIEGKWANWQNADFESGFEVGELHVHGNELYYHSYRSGGQGSLDIWKLTLTNSEWQNPENVTAINSSSDEGWPYVTRDGNELWFNRTYQGTPGIYRSIKQGEDWQVPELIISQFAGEPTLDKDGNILFVHHYYEEGVMIEADIYIAYKK